MLPDSKNCLLPDINRIPACIGQCAASIDARQERSINCCPRVAESAGGVVVQVNIQLASLYSQENVSMLHDWMVVIYVVCFLG